MPDVDFFLLFTMKFSFENVAVSSLTTSTEKFSLPNAFASPDNAMAPTPFAASTYNVDCFGLPFCSSKIVIIMTGNKKRGDPQH